MKVSAVCWPVALAAAAMLVAGCSDNDSSTGPSGPTLMTQADLVGTWMAVKLVGHEQYDTDGDGVFEYDDLYTIAPTTDTLSVLQATADTIRWYEYFPDDYGQCFMLFVDPYQVSQGDITGGQWDYSVQQGTDYYRITTSGVVLEDTLVITYIEAGREGPETWVEAYTYYFVAYSGDVPPGSWPTNQCILLKRRGSR